MTERQTSGLSLGSLVASDRAALRRAIAQRQVDLADLIAGDGPEPVELTALPMTLRRLIGALGVTLDESRLLDAAGTTTMERQLRDLPVAARRRLADALRRQHS